MGVGVKFHATVKSIILYTIYTRGSHYEACEPHVALESV
jgi:hypothetical protein